MVSSTQGSGWEVQERDRGAGGGRGGGGEGAENERRARTAPMESQGRFCRRQLRWSAVRIPGAAREDHEGRRAA